jgi:hypothetical protein
MSTPGFAAEASLYTGGGHYIALQGFGPTDGTVFPQRICNEQCLDDCSDLCLDPSDCYDLPVALRAQCIRLAVRCHLGCVRRCCH